MSEYVIRSWRISETVDSGPQVIIEGRPAGILAWILSAMKIDSGMTFIVTHEKIVYTASASSGRMTYVVPLDNVCSTYYGIKKPWLEALILALAIGIATAFLFGVPGIVIGLLYYFTQTSFTIGFTELSGKSIALRFRRSIIEGKTIDANRAGEVSNLIQRLIDARRKSRS